YKEPTQQENVAPSLRYLFPLNPCFQCTKEGNAAWNKIRQEEKPSPSHQRIKKPVNVVGPGPRNIGYLVRPTSLGKYGKGNQEHADRKNSYEESSPGYIP